MKKILIIFIALIHSLSINAADIDTLLKQFKNNIDTNKSIESVITELKNNNYNFDYKLFLDERNGHFGKKDTDGFTLINYMLLDYMANSDHSPDLVDQIIRVAGFTSKSNLDRFVEYRGWGTFNILQATAFSCDVKLMEKLYMSVSAYWETTNTVNGIDKKFSVLSAAYSGGCYDTFSFLLSNKTTPYKDGCDFLKPPFDFKKQESEEIKKLLAEKYDITNYYSCVSRTKFKRNLSDTTENELAMIQIISNYIQQSESAELLKSVTYVIDHYGYSFPWNALIDGETILNKLINTNFGRMASSEDRTLNSTSSINSNLETAINLILKYNLSSYPLITTDTGVYDTHSLLASKCHNFESSDGNSTIPLGQKKYARGDKEISLLQIMIENSCSTTMRFEDKFASVLDTGCSIFKAENYNSDSTIGRYFLSKYGFDDYDSCLNSLGTGYKSNNRKSYFPPTQKIKAKQNFKIY